MKIYSITSQKQISEKYKLSEYIPDKIKDLVITNVQIPEYNELIGTIYCFVNTINAKVYIGQTYTKYYERFGKHYVDTFTKQDDLYFHKAIRKYGGNAFNKYVIGQTDTVLEKTPENIKIIVEILDKKEIEFINQFDATNSNFGYNMTAGGRSTNTCLINHEKKIKIPVKDRKYNPKIYGDHPMAKAVLQFTFDGEYLNRGECIRLAEDNLGISIHPEARSSGGYIWIRESDFSEKLLQDRIQQIKNRPAVVENIYQYNFELELINVYDSYADVERFTGFPKESVCHALLEKRVGCGYLGLKESQLENAQEILHGILNKSREYIAKHRPIYQIYLNGDIIKLGNSAAEIYQVYPNSRASINKCLNNNLNFFNNCLGIYEDQLTSELIEEKIESSKIRHRTLVEDILSGKIPYNETAYLDSKHNTTKSKDLD